jgi:cell division GTPase FtsZ/glycosyltransferase involved in cell wall biosynthesis
MGLDYKNKNILIKTYLSESGLFYLGKSLGKHLERHNNVVFMAKEKYKKDDRGMFRRFYPTPYDEAALDGLSIVKVNARDSIEGQVLKAIKTHRIDVIISLETFMRKAQWVRKARMAGVIVCDVPMPEWTSKQFIENNSYSIFNKILCLTETSLKVFSKYKTAERYEWDYVDRELFRPKTTKASLPALTFYHPGALNPGFSQKNTTQVLEAFSSFSEKTKGDYQLLVTGRLDEKQANIVNKCKKIILIPEVLDREKVAELYDESHCLIIPSTREGLGLSFYEAKAMGCEIITVDADPMNKHANYLSKVLSYNKNESPVPFAVTSSENIEEQITKYYKDHKMKEKKTQEEIEHENNQLLEAFEAQTEDASPQPDGMDPAVLAKLKSKMSSTTPSLEEEVDIVNQRKVSIELAVIGVGQAGSRIAEVFHQKGYDVGVINTSEQDLEFIDVAPGQKLLLEGSLGGTGKDLDLGREIFAESAGQISPFIEDVISGNNMAYLAISGGGGSGSSSVDTLVPMLYETGLPVGVIYVLPKATEDAQSKKNSIETLSRLAKLTADNMVSNLIVVDNARIEQIYANLSQADFWEASNNAIVEPLHIFNSLTSTASRFTSLDPSDFGRIISCGDCSIYGVMSVDDYMEETALAEAVIESLNSNMLASGFDISQTRAGGVIITGPEEVLRKIPALNINYCFHMISEQTNGASVYQGVYAVDSDEDCVKIYSWFAGLGLPKDRVENLKKESMEHAAVATEKERNRASAMTLDLGDDKVNTVAEEVTRKIQKKKSSFSRLQRGSRPSLIDKRRKG